MLFSSRKYYQKRMPKIIIYTLIFTTLLIFSCTESMKKSRITRTPTKEKNIDRYVDSFVNDRFFQLKHITFPVISQCFGCGGWNPFDSSSEKKMYYVNNWKFVPKDSSLTKNISLSKNGFILNLSLKNSGYSRKYFFHDSNGTYYLIKLEESNL